VAALLIGSAEVWFEDLEPVESWKDFEESFIQQFFPFEDEVLARRELTNIRHTKSAGLLSFNENFREIMSRISSYDEQSIKETYLSALLTDHQIQARTTKPVLLKDAMTAAHEYDVCVISSQPVTTKSSNNIDGTSKHPRLLPLTEETRAECDAKGLCRSCRQPKGENHVCRFGNINSFITPVKTSSNELLNILNAPAHQHKNTTKNIVDNSQKSDSSSLLYLLNQDSRHSKAEIYQSSLLQTLSKTTPANTNTRITSDQSNLLESLNRSTSTEKPTKQLDKNMNEKSDSIVDAAAQHDTKMLSKKEFIKAYIARIQNEPLVQEQLYSAYTMSFNRE
jgi:hypothetical protein